MKEYLITPYGTLGSDSFTIRAESVDEAIRAARVRIANEDWASQFGWEVYERLVTFSDSIGQD